MLLNPSVPLTLNLRVSGAEGFNIGWQGGGGAGGGGGGEGGGVKEVLWQERQKVRRWCCEGRGKVFGRIGRNCDRVIMAHD